MNNVIYLIFILFFLSCKKENPDDGFYIKKDYLEYHDSISQKSFELNQSHILLKISQDTVYHWGDIKYWEEYDVKHPFPFQKIKEKETTKYFDKVEYNGSTEYFEYIKIKSDEVPLDSLGLDFSKLEKLITDKILVNNYLLNDKKVSFLKDGTVKGLNEFNKYKIYLRRGTSFPYRELNLIETNNGIWNFRIVKKKLILVKYDDQRNPETETFELSKKKLELIKS